MLLVCYLYRDGHFGWLDVMQWCIGGEVMAGAARVNDDGRGGT